MKRITILRILGRLVAVTTLSGLVAAPAMAKDENRPCSIQSIAGSWIFATDVGQQRLFPDQEGDITAIGTMNIDSEGTVKGMFDAAVMGFTHLPNVPYSGSITVEPDCRGTLTFITGAGTTRTDSIAVLNRNEIRGMSQDTANIWTYRARRISMANGLDVLEAKIDAILRRLGLSPGEFENDD